MVKHDSVGLDGDLANEGHPVPGKLLSGGGIEDHGLPFGVGWPLDDYEGIPVGDRLGVGGFAQLGNLGDGPVSVND